MAVACRVRGHLRPTWYTITGPGLDILVLLFVRVLICSVAFSKYVYRLRAELQYFGRGFPRIIHAPSSQMTFFWGLLDQSFDFLLCIFWTYFLDAK